MHEGNSLYERCYELEETWNGREHSKILYMSMQRNHTLHILPNSHMCLLVVLFPNRSTELTQKRNYRLQSLARLRNSHSLI